MSETTARAAAAVVPDIRHLATKEDLAQVAGELRIEMAELRSDIRMLKVTYGPIIICLLIKIAFFP